MLGIVSRIGQRVGIVADQSRYAVSSLINRSILPVSSSRFQSSKKKGGKSSGGNSKGVPKARSNDVDNRASNSPDASRGGSSNSNSSSNRSGGGGEREIIMHMKEITKVLPGGRVLFANVNLAFQKGAKIGILGLNGAGKSSILKILAGVDSEFDGELWRANHLRIGYLAQEPQLDESRGVHENIMDGLREKTDLLKRFDEINAELASDDGDNYEKLLAELEEVQNKIEHYDCWNLSHTVQIAKEALRVPADDADVKTLSGGERRRIALCRLLLEQPDVLLLDEPTNHLDATSVAWLERFLQDYKGTVLAITHDRYFLDNVAGWILEIDRGVAYPYEGNYSVWLEKKSDRLDMEKKTDKKKAKAMEEELQWIRQGAKGRQAKSKARIARFENMQHEEAEKKSRERFLSGQIIIPPGPRLGNQVIVATDLAKSVEGRVLFQGLNFELPKGAIVGIIGANGTGKTTLLRVLSGEIEPDGGELVVGSTVRMALVSQSRAELSDTDRVLEAVCGKMDFVPYGDFEMPARQYLAQFNLVGELQTKLVRSLSGGERNRVHLARVLQSQANLLMLDEPTNDLDIDTLRSLEEALENFDGCAIVVSHDRYFLDRTCTHMLVFHPGGRVQWFDGCYASYIDWVGQQPKEERSNLYVLPGTEGYGENVVHKTVKIDM